MKKGIVMGKRKGIGREEEARGGRGMMEKESGRMGKREEWEEKEGDIIAEGLGREGEGGGMGIGVAGE